MKVFHIINRIDIGFGGPIIALKYLAEAQIKLGYEVTIIYNEISENKPVNFSGNIRIYRINSVLAGRYSFIMNSFKIFSKLDNSIDVFHIHGLWRHIHYASFNYASKMHRAIIISTCGMLNHNAFNNKFLIKKIMWKLLFEKLFKSPIYVQVKSINERMQIEDKVNVEKIKIIGNPISDNFFQLKKTSRQIHNSRKIKYLLYVGRLSEYKGVGILLRIWNQLAKIRKDWKILLVGGDEDNYFESFQKRKKDNLNNLWFRYDSKFSFQENVIPENVVLVGPKYEKEIIRFYLNSNLFVMPSRSENFGNSILEAMSCGLPVIVNDDSPWKEVTDLKCGWYYKNNKKHLKKALKDATSFSTKKLSKMGKNGINLATRFEAVKIAKAMDVVYESAVKL